MRIVIAGGGTGGHIFPGIAIAEELKRRDSSVEVIFIGSPRGLDRDILPSYGFRFESIEVEPIRKRKGRTRVNAILKAWRATLSAMRLLKKIAPAGVIGTGGYSSGPVVMAARLLGIRTAILEQNALPGLTNRILARFVDRIYTGFEETARYMPRRKILFTGNPIRKNILDIRKDPFQRNGRFYLLVFGGSQGAKVVNAAFLDSLEYMTDILPYIQIIHQTGKEGFEEVKKAYQRKGLKVELYPFIDNMADVYRRADLIICRAGAMSVTELSVLGIPSILIPYPFSADRHQEYNARALVERGGAVMLRQDELTGNSLAERIKRFFEKREELERMKKSLGTVAKPSATEALVDDYLELIRKG